MNYFCTRGFIFVLFYHETLLFQNIFVMNLAKKMLNWNGGVVSDLTFVHVFIVVCQPLWKWYQQVPVLHGYAVRVQEELCLRHVECLSTTYFSIRWIESVKLCEFILLPCARHDGELVVYCGERFIWIFYMHGRTCRIT